MAVASPTVTTPQGSDGSAQRMGVEANLTKRLGEQSAAKSKPKSFNSRKRKRGRARPWRGAAASEEPHRSSPSAALLRAAAGRTTPQLSCSEGDSKGHKGMAEGYSQGGNGAHAPRGVRGATTVLAGPSAGRVPGLEVSASFVGTPEGRRTRM